MTAMRSEPDPKCNRLSRWWLALAVTGALLIPCTASAHPRLHLHRHHPRPVAVRVAAARPLVLAKLATPPPRLVKKVWVKGHWERLPSGCRVWVKGHWRIIR